MCENCICHDCIDRPDCNRCTRCNDGDLKIKSCERRSRREEHQCQNCGHYSVKEFCDICGAKL